MRLIKTTTLELKDFSDADLPQYAILSHRWGENEASYQDWIYITKQFPPRWGWVYLEDEVEAIKSSAGFAKIENACRLAREDGWGWIWADTCCIDKTNLAELSEAINSMYRWYKGSQVCYAYLNDVKSYPDRPHAYQQTEDSLRKSEWFQRGWTLQELLAPAEVVFISEQWVKVCDKSTMSHVIEEITGIPEHVVRSSDTYLGSHENCVSDIFSWAARRTTTRVEDRAYSLLGLVGINMPLLYGEGNAAFRRLQLEVARNFQDLSFIAWGFDPAVKGQRKLLDASESMQVFHASHALADTPDLFHYSGRRWHVDRPGTTTPMQVSNVGLSLQCSIVETLNKSLCFAVFLVGKVWIPIVAQEAETKELYARSVFPAPTLHAPRMDVVLEMTMKRQEITLAFDHGYQSLYRGISCSTLKNNCPYHVLLAFPLSVGDYRLWRVYPIQSHDLLKQTSILSLITLETHPELAFGAVELLCRGHRTALFFAVSMSPPSNLTAGRWVCQDISSTQVDDVEFYSDDLEARAVNSALALAQILTTSQDQSSPNPLCEARIEPPSQAFGHGKMVVTDELYPLDIARSQFCSGGVTKEIYSREGDQFVIAQISLP